MERRTEDDKLTSFSFGGQDMPVRFGETIQVKEGVACDTYIFEEDGSKDLAIVRVAPGASTPLQRILEGEETIEGHISGNGVLTISSGPDSYAEYHFLKDGDQNPITVKIGQTMQWSAGGESELVFYEICTPPYQEGRFENLTE